MKTEIEQLVEIHSKCFTEGILRLKDERMCFGNETNQRLYLWIDSRHAKLSGKELALYAGLEWFKKRPKQFKII